MDINLLSKRQFLDKTLPGYVKMFRRTSTVRYGESSGYIINSDVIKAISIAPCHMYIEWFAGKVRIPQFIWLQNVFDSYIGWAPARCEEGEEFVPRSSKTKAKGIKMILVNSSLGTQHYEDESLKPRCIS